MEDSQIEERNNIENINDDIDTVKFIEYMQLPLKDIKMELKKMNNELIKLDEEKEESKKNLNIQIHDLNKLVSDNLEILSPKEQDLYVVNQLERRFEIRNKDLINSKKINKTFKSQFKSMSNRINKIIEPEKINSYEDEIENLKINNLDLNIKIKDLKEKNFKNLKEIEKLKEGKEKKVKIKIDEIKNLGVKKHNYHIKLNLSDKSLANVIKEKEQLEKLYEENSKKITNNETTNTINFWLNLIKDDLKGTQEEIIKKIENNESKVLKEIEKSSNQNKSQNSNSLPEINKKKNEEKKNTSVEQPKNEKPSYNKFIKNVGDLLSKDEKQNETINNTSIEQPKIEKPSYNKFIKNVGDLLSKDEKENETIKNTSVEEPKIEKPSYNKFIKNIGNALSKNEKQNETIKNTSIEQPKIEKLFYKKLLKNMGNAFLKDIKNKSVIKENPQISSSLENNSKNKNSNNKNNKQYKMNKKLNHYISKTEGNINDDISIQYENTSEKEYKELLNKKDEYIKMINKLKESIKEAQKMSEKKIKYTSNVIADNSNRLENYKNSVSLIEEEVQNLEIVYKLTKKQLNINNTINESGIELLKKKEMENKIKNLNNKSNENSILSNNNKNEVSEIKIPEKPKINYEKIEEYKRKHTNDREARLQEIKMRYLIDETKEEEENKEENTKEIKKNEIINNEENIDNGNEEKKKRRKKCFN